jgi:hypothetical protein
MSERHEIQPIEKQIEAICRGLIYMSETDAPVQVFTGGKADRVTADTIGKAAGCDKDLPVEERSPGAFFERVTTVHEWFTAEQREDARRFAELERLLRENLTDLHVYRFGRVRITIIVAGLDEEKNILGVRTMAVET